MVKHSVFHHFSLPPKLQKTKKQETKKNRNLKSETQGKQTMEKYTKLDPTLNVHNFWPRLFLARLFPFLLITYTHTCAYASTINSIHWRVALSNPVAKICSVCGCNSRRTAPLNNIKFVSISAYACCDARCQGCLRHTTATIATITISTAIVKPFAPRVACLLGH